MSVPIRDLEIPQGTDWSETFQILDELGDPISLTLISTIKGEARRIADRLTAVAFAFTFDITDTVDNIITVSVARTITTALVVGPTKTHPDSRFFYDYEVTFVAGSLRDRIQQGKCIVYREITAI